MSHEKDNIETLQCRGTAVGVRLTLPIEIVKYGHNILVHAIETLPTCFHTVLPLFTKLSEREANRADGHGGGSLKQVRKR